MQNNTKTSRCSVWFILFSTVFIGISLFIIGTVIHYSYNLWSAIDKKCKDIWPSYKQLNTLWIQTNIDGTKYAYCQSKEVFNDKWGYDTKEVIITPEEYNN